MYEVTSKSSPALEDQPAPSSPSTLAGAARLLLTHGLSFGAAFVVGRIFLSPLPFGGATGLLTLYGATVAVAAALATLFALKSDMGQRKLSSRPATSVRLPSLVALAGGHPHADLSGMTPPAPRRSRVLAVASK